MTLPTKKPITDNNKADAIERALVSGDLAPLTPEERVVYYNRTCESLGLNPYTKPFSYMTLQGKLTLYANRSGADQLRKIHNVSLEIVSRDITDDILSVHVRAKLPDGRSDEDVGAVPFPETLRGENRANAELKCVTKAKRRATLSICGLGWLDETEVDAIAGSQKIEDAKKPIAKRNAMKSIPENITDDGEIIDDDPLQQELDSRTALKDSQEPATTPADSAAPSTSHPPDGAADESDELMKWDTELVKASNSGMTALQDAWKKTPRKYQESLKMALDRRYKPRALEVTSRASDECR